MYKEKAKKFINKWYGTVFDSSAEVTKEFKSFVRGFKNLMKEIGEINAKSFKAGHFYTSGFIKIKDKYIYVSIPDVRHFHNGWYETVLYREAENTKDYTGGSNHYSNLEDLEENIKDLVS